MSRTKRNTYTNIPMKTPSSERASWAWTAIVIILCLLAISAMWGRAYGADLPNPALTPGVSRGLTVAEICETKWGQDSRKLVTESIKNAVYAAYGMEKYKGECALSPQGCEIDHLISRELGGADAVRNLWPQPYGGKCNAHQKDHLENVLHSRVCTGLMDLDDAQKALTHDWTVAYRTYVDGKGCE